MGLYLRYFVNVILLVVVCFLLSAFMLKYTYHRFSDSTRSMGPTKSSNGWDEDTVSVPLKDIMESPVTLKQDDNKLLKVIRDEFLVPPSTLPYNLKGGKDNPSMGQATKIMEILGRKEKGFFVEAGALDGETRSNSLVFEKELGWEGILVEGDPKNFQLVTQKRRKAWTVPACLSIYPYPNMVLYKQAFNVGKISGVPLGQAKSKLKLVQVQCLPIYSILLALNSVNVDYFSLDIEGNELEVLETIPWNKVNITTLSVEFVHDKAGKKGIREYMTKQGYEVHSEVLHPRGLANDLIFYHPDLLKKVAV